MSKEEDSVAYWTLHQGWDKDYVLALLLEYIVNLNRPDLFWAFLRNKADAERHLIEEEPLVVVAIPGCKISDNKVHSLVDDSCIKCGLSYEAIRLANASFIKHLK